MVFEAAAMPGQSVSAFAHNSEAKWEYFNISNQLVNFSASE
jgi:hypothetical protein